MNTLRSSREKELSSATEPYRLKKRIGSVVYEVGIYFNQDAKETMNEKIARLIRHDLEVA